MTKAQIVERIATEASITKASAAKAFDATFDAIKETVKKGESVAVFGFGSFSQAHYAARSGVNPSTGQKLQIKARKAPKFKAAKAFKELVNK